MEGVIVCRPDLRFLRRRIMQCPTEGRRRRFVVRFEEWYGPYFFCCGCGDSWADGERLERPFARGWRERAVREHRAMWDRAQSGPGPSLEDFRDEGADA